MTKTRYFSQNMQTLKFCKYRTESQNYQTFRTGPSSELVILNFDMTFNFILTLAYRQAEQQIPT